MDPTQQPQPLALSLLANSTVCSVYTRQRCDTPMTTPPSLPSSTATAVHNVLATIHSIYEEVCRMHSLAPSARVNEVLSHLVNICIRPYSADFVQYFQSIQGVPELSAALQILCAEAEGELEAHWAQWILDGEGKHSRTIYRKNKKAKTKSRPQRDSMTTGNNCILLLQACLVPLHPSSFPTQEGTLTHRKLTRESQTISKAALTPSASASHNSHITPTISPSPSSRLPPSQLSSRASSIPDPLPSSARALSRSLLSVFSTSGHNPTSRTSTVTQRR